MWDILKDWQKYEDKRARNQNKNTQGVTLSAEEQKLRSEIEKCEICHDIVLDAFEDFKLARMVEADKAAKEVEKMTSSGRKVVGEPGTNFSSICIILLEAYCDVFFLQVFKSYVCDICTADFNNKDSYCSHVLSCGGSKFVRKCYFCPCLLTIDKTSSSLTPWKDA